MATAERKDGKLTGAWIARVRRNGTKLFKRWFPTLVEAEEYERYVRLNGKEPQAYLDTGVMGAKGRTFKDVARACEAAGGPNKAAWKRGRDRTLPGRIEYLITQIGDYNIEDVTRTVWRERIVAPLEKHGRKKGTVNRYTAVLSAILHWARKEEITDRNPAFDFFTEHDKVERTPLPSFEVEDRICDWLTANGRPIDAAVVRFLVWTGLRKGELYKLRPEQIKDDHLTLEKAQTKTNRPRSVYVLPHLAREMRAIVAARALPSSTQLAIWFERAAKVADHSNHFVIHSLRHTIRTRMRKAGVNEHVIRKMLGHSDRDASEGYDHIDLDDQRKAVEMVVQSRGPIASEGANIVVLKRPQGPEISNVG